MKGGRMKRFAHLVSLALVAAAVVVPIAQGTKPQDQTFETIGRLTGPDSAAGTWTGSGLVDDSGAYSETFRFAGRTIHAEKVLVGSQGTIVLRVQAVVVWLDECTATFKAGSWRIVDGTGAYEGLKGGGTPATTPDSFGNVCTGAIHVTHVGQAHD
jgi:hypothetical protein